MEQGLLERVRGPEEEWVLAVMKNPMQGAREEEMAEEEVCDLQDLLRSLERINRKEN
jgi:hypothetical protein